MCPNMPNMAKYAKYNVIINNVREYEKQIACGLDFGDTFLRLIVGPIIVINMK